MPKKTKIEQWEQQLEELPKHYENIKDKLFALKHNLSSDIPAVNAEVEKAFAEHHAALKRLLEVIEGVS